MTEIVTAERQRSAGHDGNISKTSLLWLLSRWSQPATQPSPWRQNAAATTMLHNQQQLLSPTFCPHTMPCWYLNSPPKPPMASTTCLIAQQGIYTVLRKKHPLLFSCITLKQEVKVIWQKAPIPRLGVTPGGRNLYHWIPGVGFPISVP